MSNSLCNIFLSFQFVTFKAIYWQICDTLILTMFSLVQNRFKKGIVFISLYWICSHRQHSAPRLFAMLHCHDTAVNQKGQTKTPNWSELVFPQP